MSAAIETASTPRQVGVYRLDEKIGSGAMGTVFRATHTTLGKQVALKLVRADDPEGEMCQRFLLEGVAASRVRHPNVVEVLDAGVEGDNAYLAMQLLEGETLAECLQREDRLPVTYAIDLILPVCAALIAAHGAGVLHRDLKPANIFLADVGRGEPEPMLLDFGISKILGPIDMELTQNPKFLGTPLYIAPEQADGAPGSSESDQYSLALSLYETLLGVRPFEKYKGSLVTLLRHVAEGQIRSARDLDASIPLDLSDALDRALATDPSVRFESMRDFGAALLPFASEARRVLWQHAFVDTERTMTSANAPVSQNPVARRVRVSVEPVSPRLSRDDSTQPSQDEDSDEFISHSKLFGHEDTRRFGEEEIGGDASRSAKFQAEESSISRRSVSSTLGEGKTRHSSPTWSKGDRISVEADRQAAPLSPRNSVGVLRPVPASGHSWSNHRLVWILSGVLGLGTLVSSGILLRHELSQGTPGQRDTYLAQITVHPSSAIIELDGQQVGQGHFVGSFAKDGQIHHLRLHQPGFEEQSVSFRDSPPPSRFDLLSTTPPAPVDQERFTGELAEASPSNQGSEPDTEIPAALPPDEVTPKTPLTARAKAAPPAPSRVGTADSPAFPSDTTSGPAPSTEAPETVPASEVPAETQDAPSPPPSPPESPAARTPPPSPKPRSIQTGNLDPWAN